MEGRTRESSKSGRRILKRWRLPVAALMRAEDGMRRWHTACRTCPTTVAQTAVQCRRAAVSLLHVLVVGLHDHPIRRHHTGAAGLGCRAVGVLAPSDVQMFAAQTAAESARVGDECTSSIRTPVNSPRRCPIRHSANTMNRSRAFRQAPSSERISFAGHRIDHAFRLGQPMSRLGPHAQLRSAADLAGQVVVLNDVEKDVQH